jgi:hypothetical protein
MSSVVISGDTSGSVTLVAPAVAGSTTLTLPVGTATLTANGLNSNVVVGTSQVTTSGTSITFSSIPSWVKRITVMLNGISTNYVSGTAMIQVGAGSATTSGYVGSIATNGTSVSSFSSGVLLNGGGWNGATAVNGIIRISNFGSNIWVFDGSIGRSDSAAASVLGGVVSLSGTLDRVILTTTNGTDSFDAGSINILYE